MQQFPSGQVFHDDDKLHVGEGVAVQYFYDVGVGESFEGLDLPKDHIYVSSTRYISRSILIFYSFKIFIAARDSLILLLASHTLPKPPSPRGFSSWY